MARVGNSSSNLSGGDKYDLLIFKFTDGYPVGNIKLAFGETPKRISGVQKVSQIFTKVLMSRKSSDVLYTSSGTDFSDFSSFSNVSDADGYRVRSEIESAVYSAETQAKYILNFPGASYESQLDSVEILGVSVNGDNVSVQIKILTKAGEEAPIALPFTSLGIEVNE
tara:strand:- start:118 stop:618 length:501 start_codon:yes stop_codon:yes gene_type:complete